MTIDVIEKDRMVLSDIDNDWIYESSNDFFSIQIELVPYCEDALGVWEFKAGYAAYDTFAQLLDLVSSTYVTGERGFYLGLADVDYVNHVQSGFHVHNLTAFFNSSDDVYYIGLDFQCVPLNELNKFFMDIMEFSDREDIPIRASLTCEYTDTITINLHFTTASDFFDFFSWLVEYSHYYFRINFNYRQEVSHENY